MAFFDKIAGLFDFSLPNILAKLKSLLSKLTSVFDRFSMCGNISSILAKLIAAATGLVGVFANALSLDSITGALDKLKGMYDSLKNLDFMPDILKLHVDGLSQLKGIGDCFDGMKSFVTGNIDTALAKLQGLVAKALAAYQNILAMMQGFLPTMPSLDMGGLMSFLPGMTGIINAINEAIACLASSFAAFAGSVDGESLGIASGATVKCDKGLAEMPLNIIPLGKEYGPGKSMTVMLNVIPYLNIPSFGSCMSSSNPLAIANFGILPTTCIPLVTPFFPTAVLTKVLDIPVATDKSECYCIFSALSSKLTVADPGQDEMTVT
ncbi:PAAR-like protein [Piscirickettsia litoralis]|uniref:Uncharacterized protein n=1 Tax=Piscirickettsia litoralis TaxID=1891921 RepID=A0ABX3A1Q1_9GAMM|nr:PAAR-like protein [Piscirickettsia litoralis]ODN42564.1 hypothetical protein BGC07_06005 [Piscirickettsia litoralis]